MQHRVSEHFFHSMATEFEKYSLISVGVIINSQVKEKYLAKRTELPALSPDGTIRKHASYIRIC